MLHAKYAADTSPECRIVLQSPNTDVLALSVAHFSDINCAEFWFKTGVKDRLHYVPVHAVSQEVGEKMCRVLLAFHAITGCNSTSALAGIGKSSIGNGGSGAVLQTTPEKAATPYTTLDF